MTAPVVRILRLRLLVITGAGASRNLSTSPKRPIILMDGWADVLRENFGPELSQLYGLDSVNDGQDFEELIGEMFRWLALQPLNRRFSWMTSGTDMGRDGMVGAFEQGLDAAIARGNRLQQTLNETLFAEFGPSRFDAQSASAAYKQLVQMVSGARALEGLIVASTNYDRSVEIGFAERGIDARIGFRLTGFNRPRLDASGLGEFQETPAVLYLHGAVGWYRADDGAVVAYPADDVYRADIGAPAVLYPSRNKIVEDTVVKALWDELDNALESATHVLVLGHGLADDHLVSRLKRIPDRLAVSYFSDADRERAAQLLPGAAAIHIDFGPVPKVDQSALAGWIESAERAVNS